MAIVVRSFEYVPTFGQDTGLVLKQFEAASQVFKTGDLVNLVASKLTLAGADPATILGIALADASGVTDTLLPVQVIREEDVFRAKFANAVVIADVFTDFEIVRDSAGVWSVEDATAANTSRVKLIEPEDFTSDGQLRGAADAELSKVAKFKFLKKDGTTVDILQYYEAA